ncbi:MAG: hypothetical protein H7836_16945, partial [Magnetococcus sp. YQC-3]
INIQTYHEAYWAENLLLKAKGKKDEYQSNESENSLKPKAKSKTWTEKVFEEMLELFPTQVTEIQTYHTTFVHTDAERASYRQSRIQLYCYMKQRLGCKKQSLFILRDMYSGFISGIVQLNDTASIKFNTQEYDSLFALDHQLKI